MVFTLVSVLSQQGNSITGNVALITGAADEPLPGEEGSNPGFAECQSLPESTAMETIYNCDAAGYKHCEDIIGNIFKFTPEDDLMNPPCKLTLPPEEAGYEGNVYPRQWIGCADPRTVIIVRYNHEEEIWEPIESISKYKGEGETSGLIVTTTVNKLSDYAIAKKTSDYLLPYEDPTTTPTCQEFSCLTDAENEDYNAKLFLATYTNPESSQIRASQDITLNACGMIKGCIAIAGDGPDAGRMCPPGIDGPAICTNSESETDCCIPARDNSCDKDCWKEQAALEDGTLITDEEGNPVYSDSTDPDCLLRSGADSLKDKYLTPKQFDIQLDTRVNREELGAWARHTYSAQDISGFESVVINGDISFTVNSRTYVWFKDFSYTDLNDIEHKLYPLRQIGIDWALPKGRLGDDDNDERDFGADDKNDNRPHSGPGPAREIGEPQTNHESIKIYDDAWGDNDRETDKSYWEYLFFHPYTWYQNSYGKTAIQFKLPNISVKSISFYALSDYPVTDEAPSFTMALNYYPANADVDNDKYGAEVDCHDAGPSIHPNAQEICNTIDDNCNGYGLYNMSSAISYPPLSYDSGDFVDDWDASGWNLKSYMSPCDGFLHIKKVDDGPVYAELWKIDDKVSSEYLKNGFNTWNYANDVRSNGEWQNKLSENRPYGYLWTSYQKILAAGDDFSQNSDEKGPPSACSEGDNAGGCDNDGDKKACVVGTRDSCNLAIDALTCEGSDYASDGDEQYNLWDRNGKRAFDKKANEGAMESTLENKEFLIDVKKGEIMVSAVLESQCGSNDEGKLRIVPYCFEELPVIKNASTIDEGINCETEQQEQRTIHFCKSDFFDNGNRECFEGEKLCTTNPTQTDGGSCDYTTLNTQTPGKINYYVYVCPTDTQEPCYKYTESSFKVCAEKESCNPATNIDMDCDGLKPYATRAEDGTADTSKTLDPDCEGTCTQDECNPVEHKWCNLGQWDINNYCQKCGSKDSSCGKACTEGERSCDGGCLPNACDVSDNKWCNSGYWDTTDYAAKCGKNDSESYAQVNDCTHRNGCDVNAHLKCFQERNRWSWGSGDIGTPYCNTACSLVDSSCSKPCTPGTCDVEAEKYCNSGIWETPDNYCAQCGAVDADCGVNICEEGTCDYGAHKVCINKLWSQPPDYCAKCAQYELETGYCACTQAVGQEEVETSCTDGKDNDCDGVKDCADPDCPSDLPECACIEGSAQTCGVNIGLCNSGTQTCSSGAWGACIGEVKPKTEVCNSFDDDCGGETDEGCGSCLAGEKRQCGIDRGSCSGGLQICSETTGLWSTCSGPVYQTTATENCDGIDNNCNGEIDESCSCVEGSNQSCGINVGLCKPGLQACAEGKWGECVGMKDKLPEVCNDGSDNDCDGLTDSADDSCSASASLSPTCYDAIQNQGEDSIDCGGTCPECTDVTCNDRQKNGDEEGMDCGGSKCPLCNGEKQKVECGDGDCNGDEDSGTCPEDCPPIAEKTVKKASKGFPLAAVLVIVLMFGIIGLLVIAFLKSRKAGKAMQEVLKGMFVKSKPGSSRQISSKPTTSAKPVQNQVFQQPSRPLTKKRSFEDEQLEKSFKEASEVFKK